MQLFSHYSTDEVYMPLHIFQHDDEISDLESHGNQYSDFTHVDSLKLAEQLTRLDAVSVGGEGSK